MIKRGPYRKEELRAGVDEAGRGAVIGPMIIACIALPCSREVNLLNIGVRDSKLMKKEGREKIFGEICSIASCLFVRKVQPDEIDQALARRGLNYLEAKIMAELIRRTGSKLAYVDAPQFSPKSFEDFLRFLLGSKVEVKAEPFADKKYPVVSAASIIAKVIRDREIERLREDYGDFGSGYPSDEKTIRYLSRFENPEEIPPIVRRSWLTFKRISVEKKSKKLEDFT